MEFYPPMLHVLLCLLACCDPKLAQAAIQPPANQPTLITFIGVDTAVANPQAVDTKGRSLDAVKYAGTPTQRFAEMTNILSDALASTDNLVAQAKYRAPSLRYKLGVPSNRVVFLAPEWYFSSSAVDRGLWTPYTIEDLQDLRQKFKDLSQNYPYMILAPGTVRFAVDMPDGVTKKKSLTAQKPKIVFNCGGIYTNGEEKLFHCKRGNAGDVGYGDPPDQENNPNGNVIYYFTAIDPRVDKSKFPPSLLPWLKPKRVNRLKNAIERLYGQGTKYNLDLDPDHPFNLVQIDDLLVGYDICADHFTKGPLWAKYWAQRSAKSIDLLLIPGWGQEYDTNSGPPLSTNGFAFSSDSQYAFPKDRPGRWNRKASSASCHLFLQTGPDMASTTAVAGALHGTSAYAPADSFWIFPSQPLNPTQNPTPP